MRRGRRKKRGTSFNPNHEYVSSAVREYLDKGGKITRLKAEKENFEIFMGTRLQTQLLMSFCLKIRIISTILRIKIEK